MYLTKLYNVKLICVFDLGNIKMNNKGCPKVAWNTEEEAAIAEFFKEFIRKGKTPNKAMCLEAKVNYKCLARREWSVIKLKVKYMWYKPPLKSELLFLVILMIRERQVQNMLPL